MLNIAVICTGPLLLVGHSNGRLLQRHHVGMAFAEASHIDRSSRKIRAKVLLEKR